MNIPVKIEDSVLKAISKWGLRPAGILKDLPLAGSPERCELRFAVECDNDKIYVIESILEEDLKHKNNIISILSNLSGQGLKAINPYLQTENNRCIIQYDNRRWQLSPFISGVPLDRPAYVFDRWRGNILAEFLIDLNNKSKFFRSAQSPFSIKDYLLRLLAQIKKFEPGLMDDLLPITRFLDSGFMDVHDKLPTSFCHGDYHPLNIIWGEKGIRAVIDWEFMGEKPEIYDVANMLGCIGIEEPEGLAGDLVLDFIGTLRESNMISRLSWSHLIEFIVALRFAWLSEWLRHKDDEMIKLETTYMNLIVNNYEKIKGIWKI